MHPTPHVNGSRLRPAARVAACLVLLHGAAILVAGGGQATDDPLPRWLRDHMNRLTGGGGRWIADNSAYRGENEPWDAYGLEWRWGAGRMSVRGRLFSLVQGQERGGDHWDYLLVWHPKEQKALLYQTGANGAFGWGALAAGPGADGAPTTELEQTFVHPNGSEWKTRHEAVETATEVRMRSFQFEGGAWKPNRSYVWRRASQ
jgi:hypothetical protein